MSINDFTNDGDKNVNAGIDPYNGEVEFADDGSRSDIKRENRIFLVIATITGAITVIALSCIALYGLVVLPNQRELRAEKDIEARVHNTIVAYEITLTHSAAEFIPTATSTTRPTNTPTEITVEPTPESPTPTSTQELDLSTSTPITVPTATPGLPTSYELQDGETPFCIARRFDVNYKELLRLSSLTAEDEFKPGTELIIPQSGRKFLEERSLKTHPTSYTITSSDTIFSIACDFGDVDPYAIIVANNLSEPYEVMVGESLYIP